MSDYKYQDYAYVPEPFGLNNTGVICWLNSMLQVLLSCSSLNKILLENENDLCGNEFAAEYIRLVKAILPRGPLENPTRFAAASANILGGFVRQLKAKGRTFNIGSSQECVDEAFTLFIDMFDCPRISWLFSNAYDLIITCKHCNKDVSTVRDKGYKINLFGQMKLTNVEDFCDWIRIHPSEHDHYKCESCGETMVRFYRIEKLKMLREIVVIVFNKFHAKDNRWFPMHLTFNAKGGGLLRYELIGQVEHGGTMFGGHYTSKARRGEKWFYFNDNIASPVGEATANSSIRIAPTSETYMLFYHIVDTIDNTNITTDIMSMD